MDLTLKPTIVTWSEMHYVFVEKVGSFMEVPRQAWDALNELVPVVSASYKITGYTALYKFKPGKPLSQGSIDGIYRAGLTVASRPGKAPKGLKYEKFKGGKYARFVLTGPYTDLPEACGYIFGKYIPEKNIKMRNAWCVENYVNDPKVTPEEKLVTQILIPV